MGIPTYFQDPVTTAARNAEYTGNPLTDVPGDGTYDDPYLGCNAAGSNAPGIGINIIATPGSGGGDVTDHWTIPDQHGAARNPQDSQHIGHDGLGEGDSGVGDTPINAWDVADLNDTCVLTVLATGWVRTAVAQGGNPGGGNGGNTGECP